MEATLIAGMDWRLNPTTPHTVVEHLILISSQEGMMHSNSSAKERQDLENDACDFVDFCHTGEFHVMFRYGMVGLIHRY